MVPIAANYRKIMDCISDAAAKSGRDLRQIRLLAAAKTQSAESIRAAVEAGVRLVGENYVQEAREVKTGFDLTVEWHMIGHLQRNKVRPAVELFEVIETVDRADLARALDQEGRKRGQAVRAFIEVNLAGEQSKSGIAKAGAGELVRQVGELSFLRVEGLMTVPPLRADPGDARRYFRELRELRDELQKLTMANVELRELSMGMTHDYPIAIEEGATIVRIGTALFGPRGT